LIEWDAKSFFLRSALSFERIAARINDQEKNIMNAFTGQTFQMNQIINIKHVVEFTALSKSKIYEMINKKSKYYDPTFPQPVRLTEMRIGWSAWEIHQWIESKMESREE
jgi:prophage regulatory protein